MSRIIVGYWDCSFCQRKKNSGLDRNCSSCGHVRNEHTVFYMTDTKVYLTHEKAKEIGEDSDWICEYCVSLNNSKSKTCYSCGALKKGNNKDYFSNKEKQESISQRLLKWQLSLKTKKKDIKRIRYYFSFVIIGIFFNSKV